LSILVSPTRINKRVAQTPAWGAFAGSSGFGDLCEPDFVEKWGS